MTDESRARFQQARRVVKAAPTIYDIAFLAGVSPSTVSRALSKPGRLNAKTEARIQAAARELNYRINPIARALPTGRTSTLGLLLADITNPMFFDAVRGVERTAADHGYTLILAESRESAEREAATAERLMRSVDALILIATRLSDTQIVELATKKPIVIINRKVPGVRSVVPDLEPGIDLALAHLAELGHVALAYLSGPSTSWISSARWSVLLNKARQLGMTIVEIGPGKPTLDGGGAALERVLAAGVTAVVAYNDLMAIGLMRAAQEAGMRVPQELSLIGFDDIFGSDFTSPQLTTIRVSLGKMGETAASYLLESIGSAGSKIGPTEGLLVTEFVERQSTAAPAPVDHGDPIRSH